MKELHHKQIIRRRVYSIPVLVIFAVVTVLAIRSAWNIIGKYRESAVYVDELKQRADKLSNEEAQLNSDIAHLGTEEGIDNEIKGKFNVSKEGEQVAIIISKEDVSTSTAISTEIWWKRMWSSIMGH